MRVDVGQVAPNHYKILCLHFLFPTFLLYMQLSLYCFFYIYILAYNCLLHSHILNLQKRDHHPIHPLSRVITIGLINLIFLTMDNSETQATEILVLDMYIIHKF